MTASAAYQVQQTRKLAVQTILVANAVDAVGDGHHFGEFFRRESLYLDLVKFHCHLRCICNSLNSLNQVGRPIITIGRRNRKTMNAVRTFVPRIDRMRGCKFAHEQFSGRLFNNCNREFEILSFCRFFHALQIRINYFLPNEIDREACL